MLSEHSVHALCWLLVVCFALKSFHLENDTRLKSTYPQPKEWKMPATIYLESENSTFKNTSRNSNPIRAVFWSRPYPSFPFNELKNWKETCPKQHSNCEFILRNTSEQFTDYDTDAVVFYAPHKKHWKTGKYDKLRKDFGKKSEMIRVLFSLEVPSRQFYQMPDAHLTMSYRTDADVNYPYGHVCDLARKVRDENFNFVEPAQIKLNRGIAIVSNQGTAKGVVPPEPLKI